MDIFKLTPALADTGAVLKLRHPVTDTVIKGMTITLLGSDSKKSQQIARRKMQANLDRMAKGRRNQSLNADRVIDEVIDDLIEMTVAWTGIFDGKTELELNPENARKVYSEVHWVKDQAHEFINERANFFEA